MELMTDILLIWLILLSVIELATIALLFRNEPAPDQKNPEVEALQEKFDKLESSLKASNRTVHEMNLDMNSLYETVDRNLRKMSMRKFRAEQIQAAQEQLEAASQETAQTDQEDHNHNIAGRIVRDAVQ